MDVTCPICGGGFCDMLIGPLGDKRLPISRPVNIDGLEVFSWGHVRILMMCAADHQFYLDIRQNGETGREVTVRTTTDAEIAAEQEAHMRSLIEGAEWQQS